MARQYLVQTRTPVEVEFACPTCGFAARATVEGEGLGTATSYLGTDDKKARAAAEEAIGEARHDAQITASIAPCPRCRKRSRAAVVGFAVRSVLAVTGFVALGVGLWWLIDEWLRWVVLFALVVGGIGSAKRRHSRYRLASSLLVNIRPEIVLPRAQALTLPKPVRPPPARSIEPTPAGDEPRTLR